MSNYPYNPPYPPPGFAPAPRAPRVYSTIGAMVRAPFFSGEVYRDVARNWGGIGFWYLFLLLLVSWILVSIRFHLAVMGFAHNQFPQMIQDFPPMTLSNGHVTSPVEQPYFVKDRSTGKTIGVLDTTGQINSMDDTDAMILITDHKCFSRQNNRNEVRETDLSKIKYFYVDKLRITGWMNTFSPWLAICLFPLVLILSMILRLVQALIYAGIAMIFSAAFNAQLTFAAAMRLAVVSVTTIILLDTVLWLGGWSIHLWWIIGFGISIIYIAMAVRANANPRQPMQGFPVSTPPVYPPQPGY